MKLRSLLFSFLILVPILLAPTAQAATQCVQNARYAYDENDLKLVKYAFANIAASTTDGALVAAVAGRKIKVLSFFVGGQGTATTFVFNSKGAGAGTAITGTATVPATNITTFAATTTGWFQTNTGEGLTVTTGVGATIGVNVAYIEAMP